MYWYCFFLLEEGFHLSKFVSVLLYDEDRGTFHDLSSGNMSFVEKVNFFVDRSKSFEVVEGRRCLCSSTGQSEDYCLTGNACNVVRVPDESSNYTFASFGGDNQVVCFDIKTQWNIFVEDYLPTTIVALYSLTLVLILITRNGLDAIDYFIHHILIPFFKILFCFKEDQGASNNSLPVGNVTGILSRRPINSRRVESRLNAHIERYRLFRMFGSSANAEIERERQRIQEAISSLRFQGRAMQISDITSGNVALKLMIKTRIYHKQNHSKIVDDYNEDLCSICLDDIKDGDRIGDLKVCNHLFHSDCLKNWLRKSNKCPLCQKQDLAFPKVCRLVP